jgi:hypothetical protein
MQMAVRTGHKLVPGGIPLPTMAIALVVGDRADLTCGIYNGTTAILGVGILLPGHIRWLLFFHIMGVHMPGSIALPGICTGRIMV